MLQLSESTNSKSKRDAAQKRVLIASYTWLTFDPPLLNLGTLLTRRGHQVAAVGISRKEDPSQEICESGVLIARVAHQQTDTALLKMKLSLRYVLLLLQIARSFKPTCYVAANWNSFLACSIVRRFVKAPILYYQVEYHGRTQSALASASLPARLALRLERKLVRGAHALFSAEPNRSRLMQQDYGLSYTPAAIFNAPLIQDHPGEISFEKTSEFKRIVYAGSIHPKTCMTPLFEALITSKIDAVFDFYGTVSSEFSRRFEELLLQARKRGNFVNYKGTIPYVSVHQALAKYDIGIVFYRSDTLNQYFCSPCKLFEYMAAGIAVLASDFPGIRSIVEPLNLGLCADAESPAAIRQALEDLTSRPMESINAMGHRARQAFLQTFGFEQQSKPLIRAIEHI